ncbi:unnamed protein product [Acanthoscelides obtectus]|uniref:Uncharacterized protein n=1 Tax=Acanthoscelides obtectus TaxID=200917 RepID=A0A9P0L647_ACAOB|nr:unnamed protein product [Acanthoscelides obtectus]CAK1642082.1 hypothetical protein AOBTE_LOCUS12825 [Acanthoscelides obtectus]
MLNMITNCTNIKIEDITTNFHQGRDTYLPILNTEIKAVIGILYLARVS